MATVLVVGEIRQEGLALLAGAPGTTVRVVRDGDPAALLGMAGDCDAILARTSPITAGVIEAAQHLKVVSRHGVGYDNVDVAALNARGIPLAIAASSNRIAVAEHALFMMLELAKRGRTFDAATRAGNWQARNSFSAFELYGRNLLIVGLGRIGREVASRAGAFGMQLVAYDPYVGGDVFERAGCRRTVHLPEAMAEADIVSLHLPMSEATRNIIDAGALALMKPSALLINTARGGLVDERALFDALQNGAIDAAGLDVFEQEPLPDNHPLLQCRDVLASPHIAGVTGESTVRMAVEAAQNILDVLAGKLDPQVIVNLDSVQRAA